MKFKYLGLAALIAVLVAAPIQAQNQTQCPSTAVVSAGIGVTQTVIASRADQPIYVCGYQITGDTAGTRITIKAGTTALTGAMVVPVSGALTFSSGSYTFTAGIGVAINVTCGTGACEGFLTFK